MPRLVRSKPGETQDTLLSLSSDDESDIEVEVKAKFKPLRRLRRGAASQESSRPDECHNCDDDEEEEEEGSDLDDFVVPDDAEVEYSGASESEEEEEIEPRKRRKKQRSRKKPKAKRHAKQKTQHPEYPTQTADDIEMTILQKYSHVISFKRFEHDGQMYNVVYRVADSLPHLPHGHYNRILVPILEDVFKRNAIKELDFPFFTGLDTKNVMVYDILNSGFKFDFTTGKKTSYFGCICTQAPNKGKISCLYGVRDEYSGVYFMIGSTCLGHILGLGVDGLSVLPNQIHEMPGFVTDLLTAINRG